MGRMTKVGGIDYFLLALLIRKAFTTIAFGCMPTGIRVRSEYSVVS